LIGNSAMSTIVSQLSTKLGTGAGGAGTTSPCALMMFLQREQYLFSKPNKITWSDAIG